jgi:hypothetical protein
MMANAETMRMGWMGYLVAERDALLTEITIPGTHDSGTSGLNSLTASWCQSLTIEQQIEAGIRFLDIRLVPEGNDFRIWHGSLAEGETNVMFSQVIETCRTFFGAHGSECIVMSIKNEHGTPDLAFEQQIQALYANTPRPGVSIVNGPDDRLFYTAATVPTLGQAKGQIVVFRRYAHVGGTDAGIDATIGWPNDNKTSGPTHGPVPMMIQDVYRMRFADQGDIKWKDHVLDFLNQAMVDPTTSRTWWINFTSASGGGLPKTFAAEVNGLFTDWLERQIGAAVEINRLGTVPMDFPSHRMIDALIAANFATSTNLVEVDNRDYDVRLASPGNPHCLADCHQTHAGGTYYGWSSATACKHRLAMLGTNKGSFIVPGTVVYLQSMQADMNGYVYLTADSQFNLWYSASASKAQQWAVERVDPTVSGYIVRGERVRFKSLQQTNDAGKRMYLSAESDGYLGTRSSASDGAEKNLGIEWTIG